MPVNSARGLRSSRTALLTTYRRDGRPVLTPVSIALAGGRAYFVTAVDSGKAKRVAHCEEVVLAPCTTSGRPLGPGVAGRSRLVDRASRRHLTRVLLRPTGALFWSWLLYRVQGHPMAIYQVDLDTS
jgi:PPOX class probable F420-dependent enzyme